jgi:hypothetical protein
MFILAPGEQRRRLFIIDDVWREAALYGVAWCHCSAVRSCALKNSVAFVVGSEFNDVTPFVSFLSHNPEQP